MAYGAFFVVLLLILCGFRHYGACMSSSQMSVGSRLEARKNQTLVSDDGTFALGFTPVDKGDRFQLAIWFADFPGDRAIVWSANRNSAVTNNAILELHTNGNLVLINGDATIWTTNTSVTSVEFASLLESGNFILYNDANRAMWQSFSHPSDTLLPNQPLTVSMELTTAKSPSHGGYYALKMLQQRTSLSLALTYNMPESTYNTSPESYYNNSYWTGPEILNVTGDVIAVLDEAGVRN